MTFNDILHQHFDGTLGDADQAEFFHSLSVSDEKRAAYNEFIRLRSWLIADRGVARLPNAVAERALGAVLNASQPMQQVAVAAAGAPSMKAILPIVAIVAMTFGGWIGYSAGHADNQSPAIVQKEISAAHSNTIPQTIETKGPTRSSRIKRVERPVAFASREPAMPPLIPLPSSTQRVDPIVVHDSVSRIVEAAHVDHAAEAVAMPMESPHVPVSADQSSGIGVTILQGAHIAQKSIYSANLPAPAVISAIQLQAGVHVNEFTTVGVVIGQNAFALQYIDQSDPLVQKTYSQFSTVLFAGGFVRRTIPIAGQLATEISLAAAGCSLGPVGDGSVMLSYPINRLVTAAAGVQYEMLFSRHNGAWLNSESTSVIAGIVFGL